MSPTGQPMHKNRATGCREWEETPPPPTPRQEDEEGAPPKQCALPAHGMQGRGEPRLPQTPRGDPPSSVCSQRTACRDGEERGGEDSSPKERGGAPPREGAHALCAWPDTGDGGKHPRPENPPPPQRKTKQRGGGRIRKQGRRRGRGECTLPIREKGDSQRSGPGHCGPNN